ncbi:MAG: hypothetical protein JMHAAFGB_01365 [Dehalococcoides mccartyi]|nr:hypothetical protein [Dehalococcoides mccartyi]
MDIYFYYFIYGINTVKQLGEGFVTGRRRRVSALFFIKNLVQHCFGSGKVCQSRNAAETGAGAKGNYYLAFLAHFQSKFLVFLIPNTAGNQAKVSFRDFRFSAVTLLPEKFVVHKHRHMYYFQVG